MEPTQYFSVPQWLSSLPYISVPEWLPSLPYLSVPEWLASLQYISVPEWLPSLPYISVPEWLASLQYISVPEWLPSLPYLSVPEWLASLPRGGHSYSTRRTVRATGVKMQSRGQAGFLALVKRSRGLSGSVNGQDQLSPKPIPTRIPILQATRTILFISAG